MTIEQILERLQRQADVGPALMSYSQEDARRILEYMAELKADAFPSVSPIDDPLGRDIAAARALNALSKTEYGFGPPVVVDMREPPKGPPPPPAPSPTDLYGRPINAKHGFWDWLTHPGAYG